MITHTPGPWRVATFDGPNEYASIEAGNEISELVRICDIPSWPCATNEMEANAILISSAPELLAALEAAVTAVEYYHEHEGAEETMRQVRDAITKATGGAK